MGAVFALFSAWYFWIPKIVGLFYNQTLSKVHFWILFVGVNLTFFPQHFLGLQGMPRRISDYPDAFAGWNMVSSLGSIISVIATYVFLHIVYVQLRGDLYVTRNPWTVPGFYNDILRVINTRVSTSLEWVLTNPPKPHAFLSLPLQSNQSFMFKHLWSRLGKINFKNLLIRISVIFFTGLAIRSLIFYVYDINVLLQPWKIISLTYYGFMAIFTVIQLEFFPSQIPMTTAGDIYIDNNKLISDNTHYASNGPTTNGHHHDSEDSSNNSDDSEDSPNNPDNSTHNTNNPDDSADIDMTEDDNTSTYSDTSEGQDIVDDMKEETAAIDGLINSHTEHTFGSIEEELIQVESAKKSLENLSKLLDDLEKVLKDKRDSEDN